MVWILFIYLLQKRILTTESQNSHFFSRYSPLTLSFFFSPSCQVADASSIKYFILTCSQLRPLRFCSSEIQFSREHHHWSKQIKITGASFKAVGRVFHDLLPMSSSSNLSYVDEHWHAVRLSFLTASQDCLQNRFLHSIAEQVTLMLCFNCYTMWNKIT